MTTLYLFQKAFMKTSGQRITKNINNNNEKKEEEEEEKEEERT
jgi:hypothetical protein